MITENRAFRFRPKTSTNRGNDPLQVEIVEHHSARTHISESLVGEIKVAIASLNVRPRRGNAGAVRSGIIRTLTHNGWSAPVQVDSRSDSRIEIASVKAQVGLSVQTGNVSRYYADLLKLETLHKRRSIVAGVLVVFTRSTALQFGSNLANLERVDRELRVFKDTINVPILLIGIHT